MGMRRGLEWLGFGRAAPAVGLLVTDEAATVAVVRPDPIRLVAFGRVTLDGGLVVGGDVRLVAPTAARVGRLVGRLGLPDRPATVAVVEPDGEPIDLGGIPVGVAVVDRGAERMAEVATGAGLELVGFDTVPTAAARLAAVAPMATGALAAGRWVVSAGTAMPTPVGSASGHRLGLRAGDAPDSLLPVTILPGLRMPRSLRADVDIGRDGVAIGAALAGLGLAPIVRVRTRTDPVGPDWLAQPVAWPGPADNGPDAVRPSEVPA